MSLTPKYDEDLHAPFLFAEDSSGGQIPIVALASGLTIRKGANVTKQFLFAEDSETGGQIPVVMIHPDSPGAGGGDGGTSWSLIVGTDDPTANVGNDGDYYFQANGKIYSKSAGAWQYTGVQYAAYATLAQQVSDANAAVLAAQAARDAAGVSETNAGQSATAANDSKLAAAQSASDASTSAGTASSALTQLQTSLAAFNKLFLGPHSSDPTTDNDGNALLEGAQYFNDVNNIFRVYHDGVWEDYDADAQAQTANAQLAAQNAGLSAGAAQAAQTAAESARDTANGSKTAAADSAAAALASQNTAEAVATSLSAGQCYLSYAAPNLLLSRRNGRFLCINGKSETIPVAGVTLAPTGNVVNTFYYIYAYMNAGVMTLEASTTAYVIDNTYGIPVKSGDATRTLVGAAWCPVAGTWDDLVNGNIFVLSWFNRKRKVAYKQQAFVNTQQTTATELGADATHRIYFIAWGDEVVQHVVTGYGVTTAAGAGSVSHGHYIDGNPNTGGSVQTYFNQSQYWGINLQNPGGVYSEGALHYNNVWGLNSLGVVNNYAASCQHSINMMA